MKKILTATYEAYSRDPRAYKIDMALAKKYDVVAFVKDEDLCAFNSIGVNFSTVKEPKQKNKFIRLLFFWKKLLKEAKKEKPEYFIAHNYYLVLPAYIIKKIIGCKVIYDSYELYVPSKRNTLSRRQLLFYYIEKFCIKSFDLIISANEERARMMKVKFDLPYRPISIMNISSSLFETSNNFQTINEKYPVLKQFFGKIKLVYQGFLSEERELDRLIDIVRLLNDSYALIYVGDGPEKEKLEKKVKKENLSNRVLFLGKVPMQDVAPILSYCDYGIVSYPFGDYNNRYCAPNKIFEYPGAGLPMISSKQTTIVSIVKQYDIAEFVDYSEPKKSADQIRIFTRRVNKNNASLRIKQFINDISWNMEENKLLKVFEKLC